MGVAVLTIVVSVLAGTLLAFLPRRQAGWMGPLRTFGLAAALSVVALHMVPESIEAIGGWAVPALVLGLLLPPLVGSLGSLLWRAGQARARSEHVKLEAGYAGLLVHKVFDGIALGVYAGDLHSVGGGHGFAAALAAHIVPVVAIVVLTFDSVRGRGSALIRALGLGLAGLLGVLLTRLIALGEVTVAHGWLSAIAAGLLLHVVTHDLGVDLPTSALGRALDLLMAGLGLLVSRLGGALHHGHAEVSPVEELLDALGSLALEMAPLLLSGVLLGTGLAHWGTGARASGRGAWPRALDRLPPFTAETLVLLAGLCGWMAGGIYLAGAVALSLLAAGIRWAPAGVDSPPNAMPPAPSAFGFAHRLERRVVDLTVFMMLGLVVAALAQVLVGHGLPPARSSLLGWLMVVVVSSFVCPPSAVPLVAVLVGSGVAEGASILALLLGSAARMRSLSLTAATPGSRGKWPDVALGTVSALLALWIWVGPVTSAGLEPPQAGISGVPPAVLGSWPWRGAFWLSTCIALGVAYRRGFRGLLLPLEGHAPGPEAPHWLTVPHDHPHHGHAHGLDEPADGLKIPKP